MSTHPHLGDKPHTDTLVRVLDHWDGWRTAEIRMHDLLEIHWLQPAI
jgi:hypothetical protein